MTVLAGFFPDRRGEDGLALGALLARVLDERLVVAHVHAPAWPVHSKAKVDHEWLAYLRAASQEALDRARDQLARTDPELAEQSSYVAHAHRGSGRGLIDVARDVDAGFVVIGSAPGGPADRIAVGSTADQLLHGASAPVMLAPDGYADRVPDRIDRLSVAYLRNAESRAALSVAAGLGQRVGIPLRLVTVVPRPGWPYGSRFRSEDRVLRDQCAQAGDDLREARTLVPPGVDVTTEVLAGDDVNQALAGTSWEPGELLLCASSDLGPVRRVFLGDTAMKIVRCSPCPAAVLPRYAGH